MGASKYRHVFADPPKREVTYQELRISKSAWDSNMISANPYFFAVNWNAGGGGAFMVNSHSNVVRSGLERPFSRLTLGLFWTLRSTRSTISSLRLRLRIARPRCGRFPRAGRLRT